MGRVLPSLILNHDLFSIICIYSDTRLMSVLCFRYNASCYVIINVSVNIVITYDNFTKYLKLIMER